MYECSTWTYHKVRLCCPCSLLGLVSFILRAVCSWEGRASGDEQSFRYDQRGSARFVFRRRSSQATFHDHATASLDPRVSLVQYYVTWHSNFSGSLL